MTDAVFHPSAKQERADTHLKPASAPAWPDFHDIKELLAVCILGIMVCLCLYIVHLENQSNHYCELANTNIEEFNKGIRDLHPYNNSIIFPSPGDSYRQVETLNCPARIEGFNLLD
jgi:hypothetical protein